MFTELFFLKAQEEPAEKLEATKKPIAERINKNEHKIGLLINVGNKPEDINKYLTTQIKPNAILNNTIWIDKTSQLLGLGTSSCQGIGRIGSNYYVFLSLSYIKNNLEGKIFNQTLDEKNPELFLDHFMKNYNHISVVMLPNKPLSLSVYGLPKIANQQSPFSSAISSKMTQYTKIEDLEKSI